MHDSKQSTSTSFVRLVSNAPKTSSIIGWSDTVYETTKLAALVDTLRDEGCPLSKILRGVGISASEVHSPTVRVSQAQLVTALKNGIRLSKDPHLPYRVGASMHLSGYGMYGFAVLCCPDFRNAMAFAKSYHELAAPLASVDYSEEDGLVRGFIEPKPQCAADPAAYRFVTELQIGILLSLMRDVIGPSFSPDEIKLAYPEARDFYLPSEQTGCQISFNHACNEVIFSSRWLNGPAILSNKVTYPAIARMCDELLEDLRSRSGLVGAVRSILLGTIGDPPALSRIAGRLGLSDRSLRRQLREQGISFRDLLDDLRTQIALKYLRTTQLTHDEVALALGFSDASNFRRAFRRWTGKSPSEIRLEHKSPPRSRNSAERSKSPGNGLSRG